ncbi:MAG: DUF362 domain-containing protein [Desulfomonile tiedjei]|uniref:DUF362 domain-containing protein n=1 Tax=Desulfomonile tiedjei TaxID=2358 RepID=A0A9D6Z123_9BACT|nr:DUF362 domain-containing protein [Desulfomonile tiedjei]
MAKVYWIKGRSAGIHQSIISKISGLLSLEELARLVVPEESLALKINLSEMGYSHYLPPVVVTSLFEKTRDLGARPVVTDSGSLFKGSRFSGFDWINTALLLGYSSGETFDSQLMLAGGYTHEEGKFYPAEGRRLGGVELGSLLTDTGNVVVISHVTAHPLMGLTGAVYNLGVGMLTGSGKLRVHSCLEVAFDPSRCDNCGVCLSFCPTGALSNGYPNISYDPEICNNCLGCFLSCPNSAMSIKPEGIPVYQESVVEAACTATDNLRGSAFFINFLSSVTPQTDDHPFSDIPFVPDLGILASEDPVAVDWATYQIISSGPGVPGSVAEQFGVLHKGEDKIKAISGIDPESWIQYAEQMNLGSRDCEFLSNT